MHLIDPPLRGQANLSDDLSGCSRLGFSKNDGSPKKPSGPKYAVQYTLMRPKQIGVDRTRKLQTIREGEITFSCDLRVKRLMIQKAGIESFKLFRVQPLGCVSRRKQDESLYAELPDSLFQV